MQWRGRLNYLGAVHGEKRIEVYAWDLVWKLVQMRIDGEIPMPSVLWEGEKKTDNRTTQQIVDGLMEKLEEIGGE